MEDMVKDAVMGDLEDPDPILDRIIFLTTQEIVNHRYLFQSPLEEPYFYQKYFRKWVEEGIREYITARENEDENVRSLQET
jgi:hypothetical protein